MQQLCEDLLTVGLNANMLMVAMTQVCTVKKKLLMCLSHAQMKCTVKCVLLL